MKTADGIVVLGHGFVKEWEIPAHVYDRLRFVAKLYRKRVAPKVVLCGKWSINWDHRRIIPPVTEAEVMKKVLVRFGIPEARIIKEERSQDTIGNMYFLKKTVVEPNQYKKILFVSADFHAKRVQFLFEKIFGHTYKALYITTPTEHSKNPAFLQMQEEVIQRQQNFLASVSVSAGEDRYLATRLYTDPYYQERRPSDIAMAAMGVLK